MSKPNLEELLQQLPQELSPQRDLWPDIQQRLAHPPALRRFSAPRWQTLAIACSLVVISILGVKIWQLAPLNSGDPQMLAMLAQLKQQHLQQVALLEQNVNYPQWQHASVAAPLSRGVDELRQATEQIYQALQRDPKDQQLWQLWLWTQQRELELLTQGQQLPHQIGQDDKGTRI